MRVLPCARAIVGVRFGESKAKAYHPQAMATLTLCYITAKMRRRHTHTGCIQQKERAWPSPRSVKFPIPKHARARLALHAGTNGSLRACGCWATRHAFSSTAFTAAMMMLVSSDTDSSRVHRLCDSSSSALNAWCGPGLEWICTPAAAGQAARTRLAHGAARTMSTISWLLINSYSPSEASTINCARAGGGRRRRQRCTASHARQATDAPYRWPRFGAQ